MMTSRLAGRVTRARMWPTPWVAVVLVIVELGLAVSLVWFRLPPPALAVLVVGVAAVVTRPMLVAVMVFPAVFAYQRVGPAALNLSVPDALTLLALGSVLVLRVPPLARRVLGSIAIYLLLLAVTVVAVPTLAGVGEWLHRVMMLGGALVVGAAVGQAGYARHALRSLFAAATVVGAVAFAIGMANAFSEAAYPFGIQKNSAGALLGMVFVVAWVAPSSAALPKWAVQVVRLACAAGMVTVQSRGSLLALAMTLLFVAARSRHDEKSAGGLIPMATAAGGFGWWLLATDTNRDTKFGSVGSRQVSNDLAIDAWHDNWLFGAGMRWFRDIPGYIEPHNVVTSGLSESGVLGLVALTLLLVSVGMVLRSVRHPLADAALAVLVFRVASGLFDIFWVSGRMTLLWLVVGLACGTIEQPAGRRPGRCQAAAMNTTARVTGARS